MTLRLQPRDTLSSLLLTLKPLLSSLLRRRDFANTIHVAGATDTELNGFYKKASKNNFGKSNYTLISQVTKCD